MIWDFLKYGAGNIGKRRLRSWLTMIGIFVGIAAVVALVSLGQGLTKYVDEEFAKLGRDKIIIQPKGTLGGVVSVGGVEIDDSDLREVLGTKGVVDATGMNYGTVKIEFNDQVRYYFNIGIPQGKEGKLVYELFTSYDVEVGRNLKKGDKNKVVLGHYFLDRNLFEKNVKVGDKILLNDEEFEVIGFYEIIGNPSDDTQTYITREAYLDLFDVEDDKYDYLLAKSDISEEPEVVVDRIEETLRKHRDKEEGSEDVDVVSFAQYAEVFKAVFNVVQVVIIGIACISLIVGGIGIMNTMFTAVLQRTQEIGIMKSVGARNSDIMILFLIESGILGLAGGAIGIIFGASFAKLIEVFATVALESTLLQAYFPPYLIVGSLVFSFVVGALSGIIPAYRASKLKPVDALRYE